MKTMFPEERHKQILNILETATRATVADLTKAVGASEATIRRDLQLLESEGKLKRSHGGAILKALTTNNAFYFQEKFVKNKAEKDYIASLAQHFIKDKDIIILNVSTITLRLAHLLKGKKITVITNSIAIAEVLSDSPSISLIVTGGINRANTKSLVGTLTISTLKMVNANKAFIAINAIDEKTGFTTPNLEDAIVKKTMIEQAKEIFFLAESSKFDQFSFAKVSDISEPDMIITDKKLSPEIKARYEKYLVIHN